jgi:hypothetical protein
MRISRARLLAASVLSVAALACTENSNDALGPSEAELDPVTVPEPSFSYMAGSSCRDAYADAPSDIAEVERPNVSPCDAVNGVGGLEGFYFLPSLVGNPGVSGDLQSGLAADLIVEAVPDPSTCAVGVDPGCQVYSLRVREKGGVYSTSWSLNKKQEHLAETLWNIRVGLETDAGLGVLDTVRLGHRWVLQTNSPSTDQPSNDPTLDIQFGSNQGISFFIARDACTNLEAGTSVTCIIPDDGGTLGLVTPIGQQIQLNVGPGNGARTYTLESTPGAVDIDLRKFGADFTVTADPPFGPDERLNASDVRVCEPAEFDTSGGSDAFIVQQDEQGQSVLSRFDVSCPLFTTSVGLLENFGDRLGVLASVFAPRPLIATSALKAGTGGGGTLRRLSSFVLAEVVEMDYSAPADGNSEIDLGDAVTATVQVTVEDGTAASNAKVRFFAMDGDVISCAGAGGTNVSPTSCYAVTGTDGLATVNWTPGAAGDRNLYALGCGVAVPGEDTPSTATDGVLGVLQSGNGGVCDRNPFVDATNPSNGFANGIDSGLDPFEPTADAEIAINDLPLVFTATVRVCNPTGVESASCAFTDAAGGTLLIDDEDGQQVQLNIGPGNGDREYTLAFNDGAVDTDLRQYGRAVTVTADPEFGPEDRLNASNILFCRDEFLTSGSNDAYVLQQDARGQSVLPPVEVSCPLSGTTTTSLLDLLDRVGEGVLAAASWLGPQPLVATAPFKAGTGGGGTLRRLSDFDLVEMSAATIETGGGPNTIVIGESIPASVRVRVNDGITASDGTTASGATVRFFAESGDALVCSDGTPAIAGPAGTTTCVELTGTDGLASVTWTPGAIGSARLFALGCGIAVPGLDTPVTDLNGDGVLGVLQSGIGGVCDRDPFVVDGYSATDDGYANGANSGVDPFEPFGTPSQEIAINDLPIVFNATVEEPYTVIEGRSDATDGFGVRFRSFASRGDSEIWLGVSDLESGADRVEADVVWLTDSSVGDGILLSYDPAGATGGQLLAQVTVPGGEVVSLTYDNVAGTAPAACPASDVDVLVVEIVGRHKGTMIDLRNTAVNGIPIEPGSFSGTRGTFNWTIEGFDVTSAFTVTGELFLSGEFPPNGDALTKLQITAACLP